MSASVPFILEFDTVHYTYPGQESPALNGLTLALPVGQRIVVLGHNGSGKSTLFLHCNGILRPQSGRVAFAGQPLVYQRRALLALRQRIGVVFQQADDQLFSASVAQDISFGPLNLGLDEAEVRRRVASAAAQCGIEHLLERPTHALSGGEKASAALAGVLAMEPDVLLIDEPTASLDPPARRQVFKIFGALHRAGKTVVLATHEVEIARHWADYIVIMQAGRVLAAGTTHAIVSNETLLSAAGLDEPWYASLAQP